MKESGLTYRQIGDLLGFSRQYAHQLYSGYHTLNVVKGKRKVLTLIIKERDDNFCRFCGAQDNLIIHHIDGDTSNNQSYNLTTMCQRCHKALHCNQNKT